MPPAAVDIFPYLMFMTFPIFKPKLVNKELIMAKIILERKYLFVIADKPIPVVRLSILTDKPKRRYPEIVKRDISFFLLILDIIISIDIAHSIIPTIICGSNNIFLIIIIPIVSPISGIIK